MKAGCKDDDAPLPPPNWYAIAAGVGTIVTMIIFCCFIAHCVLVRKGKAVFSITSIAQIQHQKILTPYKLNFVIHVKNKAIRSLDCQCPLVAYHIKQPIRFLKISHASRIRQDNLDSRRFFNDGIKN